MKIAHKEKVETTQEVIDDILCNACGQSCRNGSGDFHGLLEACVSGGYGAKLGDGLHYEFSLCEGCLEVMFKDFKIPVEKSVSGWLEYRHIRDEKGDLLKVKKDALDWGG